MPNKTGRNVTLEFSGSATVTGGASSSTSEHYILVQNPAFQKGASNTVQILVASVSPLTWVGTMTTPPRDFTWDVSVDCEEVFDAHHADGRPVVYLQSKHGGTISGSFTLGGATASFSATINLATRIDLTTSWNLQIPVDQAGGTDTGTWSVSTSNAGLSALMGTGTLSGDSGGVPGIISGPYTYSASHVDDTWSGSVTNTHTSNAGKGIVSGYSYAARISALSGTLKTITGQAVSGATIEISKTDIGGIFSAIETATTDSGGNWAHSLTQKRYEHRVGSIVVSPSLPQLVTTVVHGPAILARIAAASLTTHEPGGQATQLILGKTWNAMTLQHARDISISGSSVSTSGSTVTRTWSTSPQFSPYRFLRLPVRTIGTGNIPLEVEIETIPPPYSGALGTLSATMTKRWRRGRQGEALNTGLDGDWTDIYLDLCAPTNAARICENRTSRYPLAHADDGGYNCAGGSGGWLWGVDKVSNLRVRPAKPTDKSAMVAGAWTLEVGVPRLVREGDTLLFPTCTVAAFNIHPIETIPQWTERISYPPTPSTSGFTTASSRSLVGFADGRQVAEYRDTTTIAQMIADMGNGTLNPGWTATDLVPLPSAWTPAYTGDYAPEYNHLYNSSQQCALLHAGGMVDTNPITLGTSTLTISAQWLMSKVEAYPGYPGFGASNSAGLLTSGTPVVFAGILRSRAVGIALDKWLRPLIGRVEKLRRRKTAAWAGSGTTGTWGQFHTGSPGAKSYAAVGGGVEAAKNSTFVLYAPHPYGEPRPGICPLYTRMHYRVAMVDQTDGRTQANEAGIGLFYIAEVVDTFGSTTLSGIRVRRSNTGLLTGVSSGSWASEVIAVNNQDPSTLVALPPTESPFLLVDRTDVLWLLYQRRNQAGTSPAFTDTFTCYRRYSLDHGVTWRIPIDNNGDPDPMLFTDAKFPVVYEDPHDGRKLYLAITPDFSGYTACPDDPDAALGGCEGCIDSLVGVVKGRVQFPGWGQPSAEFTVQCPNTGGTALVPLRVRVEPLSLASLRDAGDHLALTCVREGETQSTVMVCLDWGISGTTPSASFKEWTW